MFSKKTNFLLSTVLSNLSGNRQDEKSALNVINVNLVNVFYCWALLSKKNVIYKILGLKTAFFTLKKKW